MDIYYNYITTGIQVGSLQRFNDQIIVENVTYSSVFDV